MTQARRGPSAAIRAGTDSGHVGSGSSIVTATALILCVWFLRLGAHLGSESFKSPSPGFECFKLPSDPSLSQCPLARVWVFQGALGLQVPGRWRVTVVSAALRLAIAAQPEPQAAGGGLTAEESRCVCDCLRAAVQVILREFLLEFRRAA